MKTIKWKEEMGTHDRVGQKLMELREKAKLSRTELAKAIGCSPSAIFALERGNVRNNTPRKRVGSMELMEGILHALGLDMAALKAHVETSIIPLRQPTYRKTYLKQQNLRDVPQSRQHSGTLREQMRRAVG